MQGWLVVPVSLAYLGALFIIAWYGDIQKRWLARWRPWIYSLDCGVLYLVDLLRHGRTGEQQSLVFLAHLYRADFGIYHRMAGSGSTHSDREARTHHFHR